MPDFSARWLKTFQQSLLEWYADHKRDLPWRHSDDPYAVWISEMMLQQTQVVQAQPYYKRFMARFPTIRDLGEAPLDDVLKLWEGLGYYARARNLHRAAQQVVREHGACIPDDMEKISSLPGIGPYTSAAILSIAYHQDYAVVDGNVIRVLSRLFHLTEDPAKTSTKRLMTDLAGRLLKEGRAADFNQAMMELGATVCTPRNPSCKACPVKGLCKAVKELDDPSVLPRKAPRKKRPHYRVSAGIIQNDDKILIVQRPLDGLLGGLWEFPGGRCEHDTSDIESCLIEKIRDSVGLKIQVKAPLAVVKHAFTHFEITLYGYYAEWIAGKAKPLNCHDCRWISPGDLKTYAFSKAHNRLIDAMQAKSETPQLGLFE